MAQGQSAIISDPLGNIVTANGTSFQANIDRFSSLFVAGLPNKTIKKLEK
jgi:hypothetical protein